LIAAIALTCSAASAQALPEAPAARQSISDPLVGLGASPAATYDISEASLGLRLPDAPSPDSRSIPLATPDAGSLVSGTSTTLPEASRTEKYIEPDQLAPSLTAGDKVRMGLKDAFSPFASVGWLASAGYEQALNGSPNYGTDRGAFGQRLGAAAIRDATEGIFSDSVMSPLLREDPRYYRMGPAHNFFIRAVYAVTRPIITRTDGGRTFPNLALLSGTLAGSALTNTYYPQLNRGPSQTMETFGGSLGGSAVGDVVSEFLDDAIGLFHRRQ
jgi:hypothetical protein